MMCWEFDCWEISPKIWSRSKRGALTSESSVYATGSTIDDRIGPNANSDMTLPEINATNSDAANFASSAFVLPGLNVTNSESIGNVSIATS